MIIRILLVAHIFIINYFLNVSNKTKYCNNYSQKNNVKKITQNLKL
jgi:hypothetical protein